MAVGCSQYAIVAEIRQRALLWCSAPTRIPLARGARLCVLTLVRLQEAETGWKLGLVENLIFFFAKTLPKHITDAGTSPQQH